MRSLGVGFLGKLGVDDLALRVGEERRAAVFAVFGGEGSGELLHVGDAALGELCHHLVEGAGMRVPASRCAVSGRRARSRRGTSPVIAASARRAVSLRSSEKCRGSWSIE